MTNKLMDKNETTQELVNSRQRSSGYKKESYGYIFIRRHADSLLDDFDIFLGGDLI